MRPLLLRITSTSQPAKVTQLDRFLTLPAERGTHYSIIDPSTNKPAKGLVLKKHGDALVAEVDGQTVAQIDHFYEDGRQAAFEVESAHGADAGHLITNADPAAEGSDIVWRTSDDLAPVVAPEANNSGLLLGGAALGGLMLAAAAGGGGGGSGGSPAVPAASSSVAVTVVGGPIITGHGLKVELFAADGTTRIGEATLDANGQVTVNVGGYVGVVIAHVVDANAGADYLDEATNAPKDLNADLYGIGVVSAVNSTLTLNINALTTVAFHKVVEAAGSGNAITVADANETNAAVAQSFGLSDLNSTTVITVNGTTTYDPNDGLNQGEVYGAVLAALSGSDQNNGGNSQTTIDHLVAGITVTNGLAILNANTQQEIIAGGQTAGVNSQGETSVLVDTIAPGFTSGAVASPIDENSGTGQAVYTATVTDASTVTYSLKAGSDAGLSINGTSGAVILTGNPDFETKPSYSFTVVATDAAGNASEQAVTLAINDRDEVAPSITSGSSATAINENSGAGQVIYTASSTGSGDIATGTTTYSLKAGSDAGLSINGTSGAVILTGNPDFETKPSYSFTVVATDAAGNASEQAVTLAINNRDEVAPSITSGSSATAINENSGAGQVIYTASSTDSGDIATGTTTYSLKAGSDTGLSINGTSGAVTLIGNPDFETKPSYSFTVVATDAAGNASEQAVTLAINDVVDETAPTVSIIAISSATGAQNSTLNAGDVVSVTVTLSEATTVTGTPQLGLNIGGATVQADYFSGSGTTDLVFKYTILASQTDSNGISIAANSLSLGGGTLSDAAANAATLTHSLVADNAGYLVDTTAPTANFGSATDDIGSVTGALSSGARTNDTSLALTGSCEAGSTVNVYDGSTLLGAATISGTTWTYSATVANGTTYQFNVQETDAAGNVSAVTSNFTVTGDTTVTANFTSATDDVGSLTGTLINGARTDDTSLALAGTCEAGSTVNVYNGATLLGAATISGTTWSYSATVADGTTYQFNVQETDVAGNVSAATSNFTVIGDTSVTAHLNSVTDNVGSITGALVSGARTDDSSLVLAGTCEAGSIVYIYDGVSLIGAGTVTGTSWTYTASIADGTSYLFNVTETDVAGNHSAHTSNFSVIGDTSAPLLTSSSPVDNAIAVAANSNIVLTFNENVLAGSGNIVISDGSGDTRTISISDSSQVTISGTTVTINPTADLGGNKSYDVTMNAGVITDTAGNSFSGIAQDARDFTTAASLDSSVVIFDLVQGVSSAHSSRTFAAGVDYTIYIRVNSGNAPLAHSGAHGDTWGQWTGANNLDANDKVILVGTGSGINIASGQAVNARGQGSGLGTIQWGRLGGLSSWAANLTNTGLFKRNFSGNPVGGATMSNGIYLWHANAGVNNGPWSNVHGFPGKTTGALWMNALPGNVLTSQGLAS